MPWLPYRPYGDITNLKKRTTMKKYNFFYNGTPITKAQFEKAVPESWEQEVENGVYSWGYYDAIEVDSDELTIQEEQELEAEMQEFERKLEDMENESF
jgi:hypothetical protein